MQTLDKRSKLTKMQLLYLVQEAKRCFRGWSREGLEFLLRTKDLKAELKRECRKAVAKLSQQRGS